MSESEQANGSTPPAQPRSSTDDAVVDAVVDAVADAVADAGAPNDRFDTNRALMRLLLGGMLVGADELRARLWRWELASRSAAYQATAPQGSSTWLRYALVGMAFETESRMRRGFSRMLARFERLADETNGAYTRFAYAVRGTPLDDAVRYLDDVFYRASRTVDEWVAHGWIEEQQGRRMAEQATVSVMDELLDYMAHNPEVRRLIEEQGMSMAEATADDVHERMASADQWIERLAHNLLRRPAGEKPEAPTSSASASPPAVTVEPPPAAASTRKRAEKAAATPTSDPG